MTPPDPSTLAQRTHRQVLTSVNRALRGELPPRYDVPRLSEFFYRVQAELYPGIRVLDVGSGRRPLIPLEHRPPACVYVGLDLSAGELAAAPRGSYSDVVVADVVDHVTELRGSFDLVVSWQVFEHVRPIQGAFDNLREYLRPGGRLLVQFSGAFAFFALASRLVPHRLGRQILVRHLGRDPGTVFPAWFDRCWSTALDPLMRLWSSYEVVPLHLGARYLARSRLLTAVYIGYEEWACLGNHPNLASYYEIRATR